MKKSATDNISIVAIVKDLLFSSKISAAAGELGIAVKIVRDLKALNEALAKCIKPGLIVNLNAGDLDPVEVIEIAKKYTDCSRIVCFYSHVDVELAERAESAGLIEIMPRSKFVQALPDILKQLSS